MKTSFAYLFSVYKYPQINVFFLKKLVTCREVVRSNVDLFCSNLYILHCTSISVDILHCLV